MENFANSTVLETETLNEGELDAVTGGGVGKFITKLVVSIGIGFITDVILEHGFGKK